MGTAEPAVPIGFTLVWDRGLDRPTPGYPMKWITLRSQTGRYPIRR